jgi:GntR family phosphonate transport system transcriptional regulator
MTLHAVNRNGSETVYSQIANVLKDEIATVYQPGSYLPSEQQLAKRFSVNRHTLRRAIDELVQSGHVERRHGKGTLIMDPPLDYSIHQNSRFTESLEAKGKRPDNRVLRKLVMPARGGVSQRLNVIDGEPVLFMETLRMVDGAPFCVISHFLPHQGFECIEASYSSGSLHKFIKQRLDITLRRTESLITSITPRGDDAALLIMPQHSPILRVKSVNVDISSGIPVEYAVTRFRSDRIQLSVNF